MCRGFPVDLDPEIFLVVIEPSGAYKPILLIIWRYFCFLNLPNEGEEDSRNV